MLLAYYLPLLPYFIFALGGLAWLIAVIEAMVAAPIVAMGLLWPSGDKVLGMAGDQTVKLLLNVFLRPSMMIIGFVAAMLLAAAGVKLINMGFYQAVSMVVGNGEMSFEGGQFVTNAGGIIGAIVIMCIYVWLVWTVVEKSCELIYIIPDKVLRWLQGGHQESLGAETSGMVKDMKSGMQQSAGQVGSAGQQSQFGESGKAGWGALGKAGGLAGKGIGLFTGKKDK